MKVLYRIIALGSLAFLGACGGNSNPPIASSQCAAGSSLVNNVCTGNVNGAGSNATCSDGSGFSVQANSCLPRNGCGAGSVSFNSSCTSISPTGNCVPGDVYTALYGCIPQSNNCGAGGTYGTLNGQCVQGTIGNNGVNSGQSCQFLTSPQGCLTYSPGCNQGYGLNSTNNCIAGTPSYNNGNNTIGNTGCFNTQYGCLSQGSCFSGEVTYNGQCYDLIQRGSYGWKSYNSGGYGGGFGFQIHFGY